MGDSPNPPARWQKLLVALVLGAIGTLFVVQLLALVNQRLDYPVEDDWRYYIETPKFEQLQAGSFRMPDELSVVWLFSPALDTAHVTGKGFDWFVFRFLAHDWSLLASLSFALFVGGWLLCAVLFTCLVGRSDPIALLACLLLFLLPLAGVPYWVRTSPYQLLEPAIAYHQMLPVFGLAGVGLLALVGVGRWRLRTLALLLIVPTVIFSLSYASGACALLLFGTALLGLALLGRRQGRRRPALCTAGISIATAAGACLAAHILLPLSVYGVNPLAKTRSYQLAYPTDGEFWQFFFGLFDRAVFSTDVGSVPFIRGVVVSLAMLFPVVSLAILIGQGRFQDPRKYSAAVLVAAGVTAVLGYAALVAHGRGHFGAAYLRSSFRDLESLKMASIYAHSRFFYWWITASLPLVALGWALVLQQLASVSVSRALLALLAVLALWPKGQNPGSDATYFGQWNYGRLYERDARDLESLIAQDAEQLLSRSKRGPRSLLGFLPSELYPRAEELGATFPRRWAPRANSGR